MLTEYLNKRRHHERSQEEKTTLSPLTGIHEAIEKALTKVTGGYEGWHSFVAGSLAGGTVLLQVNPFCHHA